MPSCWSKKLQPILLCSKMLELAEIPFRVEPAAAAEQAEEPAAVAVLVVEEPAAVEVLAPATEFAQAEAGDNNVPSEAARSPRLNNRGYCVEKADSL